MPFDTLFIGLFAVAFLLVELFPQVPVWVPMDGVSFPDLLGGVLVLAGREEVVVGRTTRGRVGSCSRSSPTPTR